jgi:hypothetical protein
VEAHRPPREDCLARTFENPQGLGAIGAAAPFAKILLGAQRRNLFRHGHIDELVESHAF